MPILQFQTDSPGLVGVNPRIVRIQSNDSYATVTAANYLATLVRQGFAIYVTDEIHVNYGTNSASFDVFVPSISNGVITLVPSNNSGATLPTTANHIAVFSNASGGLTEDPATAISGGNIQAGLSGTAGKLTSYPAPASTGSLSLVGVANSGNYANAISNASTGQATTWSLADPAGATSNIIQAPAALVSGNIPKNSGTVGLMVDSGIAANEILQSSFASPDTNANLIVVTTSSLSNADIVGGTNIFTPTGSKNYIILGITLNVTTSFSGGSNNSALSFTIANANTGAAIITATSTIIKATAQSYAVGQSGFTWVGSSIPITATNNLFIHVNGSSDYTGGAFTASFLLQRTS